MRCFLACFALTHALFGWGAAAATTPHEPPKRPDEPFRVFVAVDPEEADDGERGQLEEARAELAKRVGKDRNWFRLVTDRQDAEIVILLVNYWTREEKRVLSTWGVVPPTEGGQRGKTQVIEIVTYHYLQARVELFGARRMLRGEKVRNDRGKAKDAAGDLLDRLEEVCREEYDFLIRRRGAAATRHE